MAEAGAMPDLFRMGATFVPIAADNELSMTLNERMDEWGQEDDFYPAIAKAFVVASADYVYAPDRRPDTVSIDIRGEIRKLAAEFRAEAGRREVLH